MAPTANRRPGYSRRAQYGTFFGYIAGLLGAIAGAVLLIISFVDPGAFSGLRGAAADAAEPGGRAAAVSRDAGRGMFDFVSSYFRTGSQNRKLREELAEAKVRLVEAEATAAENNRLKGLLNLQDRLEEPIAVTVLTSSTASSTRRMAIIGAGSRQGVETGMPVRSLSGLIGRVLEVGSSTARVLLVTDTASVVPVRRARDGVPAFAQGMGDGRVKVRLISLGINPLKKGDILVTSGSGGLYRPGTAIASITSITSDGAIARVVSDPAATEYVLVEQRWTSLEEPESLDDPDGASAP